MKNEWMKYSSLAFQIVATMLAGLTGGYYLDKFFATSFPFFLLSLLIIAVIAVFVLIIKTTGKP